MPVPCLMMKATSVAGTESVGCRQSPQLGVGPSIIREDNWDLMDFLAKKLLKDASLRQPAVANFIARYLVLPKDLKAAMVSRGWPLPSLSNWLLYFLPLVHQLEDHGNSVILEKLALEKATIEAVKAGREKDQTIQKLVKEVNSYSQCLTEVETYLSRERVDQATERANLLAEKNEEKEKLAELRRRLDESEGAMADLQGQHGQMMSQVLSVEAGLREAKEQEARTDDECAGLVCLV